MPEVFSTLRRAVSRFEDSGNPGRFKIVQGPTSISVLPVQQSILETSISANAREVPAGKVLEAALHDLRRSSGRKVGFWRLPLNILLRKRISVSLTDRPAHEVLSAILTSTNESLSAQVLYDANVQSYQVTVYRAFDD